MWRIEQTARIDITLDEVMIPYNTFIHARCARSLAASIKREVLTRDVRSREKNDSSVAKSRRSNYSILARAKVRLTFQKSTPPPSAPLHRENCRSGLSRTSGCRCNCRAQDKVECRPGGWKGRRAMRGEHGPAGGTDRTGFLVVFRGPRIPVESRSE